MTELSKRRVKMKAYVPALAIVVSSAMEIQAQSQPWLIVMMNGDTLKQCLPLGLKDNSMNVLCKDDTTEIAVMSISKMVRPGKSQFWKYAAIGFGAGAVIGGVVGYATYSKPERDQNCQSFCIVLDFGPGVSALGGATLGGVAGFLLGGMVLSNVFKDEVHDMTGYTSLEAKINVLKEIIEQ